MESLYLLIPLSILAVVAAVTVFFWMSRDGQFEDDQGPAWSILLDDDNAVQSQQAAVHEQASSAAKDTIESSDNSDASAGCATAESRAPADGTAAD